MIVIIKYEGLSDRVDGRERKFGGGGGGLEGSIWTEREIERDRERER